MKMFGYLTETFMYIKYYNIIHVTRGIYKWKTKHFHWSNDCFVSLNGFTVQNCTEPLLNTSVRKCVIN
jgi:hypothetical protein